MAIKIISRELAVVGRIKIGGLDPEKRTTQGGKQWQAPVKFDHFVIRTMQRGGDGNFMTDAALMEKAGEKPTELDIMLLYNDNELNFRSSMAWYQGRKCACRGDGETARRTDEKGAVTEVSCPCEMKDKSPGCKPHGTLYCILRDAEIAGGVWKFSTTSWNTVSNIQNSLDFIALCTGGKIAGLPLKMRLFQKDTYTPDGKPTRIWIVGLFYMGSPVQMLEQAIENERRRLEGGVRLELLECHVRNQMQRAIVSLDEAGPADPDEIEEFHPEACTTPLISQVLDQAAKPANDAENSIKMPEVSPVQSAAPAVEETPQTVAGSGNSQTDKASILKEIAIMRSKNSLNTGMFTALVGQTIGKAVVDPAKWSDEQAGKILGALRTKYPQTGAAA